MWKAGNVQRIKYWKIILSFVSVLKPGSILLLVLNYSSLCTTQLHKLLLFQPYCPVVIETNRKIHAFSFSLVLTLEKQTYLPARNLLFEANPVLYWRVFWGKLHMFISLCLLKIDRKIFLTEVLFTGGEAQTWKALVGCELAAVKVLLLFCLCGFYQQRCTGWHFKIVAHQESGNNTLWVGKEMRFIQGIAKPAIENYMKVNFAGQIFLYWPERHILQCFVFGQ